MADRRDDVDAWLSERIEPLPPPPGTFELIKRRARRRKYRRLAITATSAAVIVAAAVTVPQVVSLPVLSPGPQPSVAAGPGQSSSATPTGTGRRGGSSAAASTAVPAPAPVPANFRPTSLTFVGIKTGWVIGQASSPGHCATQYCTSVARTDDAGSTWAGVPAPLTGAPDGATGVSRIRFLGLHDGWAFGPELWATHTGGKTWAPVDTHGLRVTDLETVGSRVFALWASCTGGGPAYAGQCTSFTLYSAPAAGGSWAPLGAATTGLTNGAAGEAASLVLTGGRGYLLAPGGALYAGPVDGSAPWQRVSSLVSTCTVGPARADGHGTGRGGRLLAGGRPVRERAARHRPGHRSAAQGRDRLADGHAEGGRPGRGVRLRGHDHRRSGHRAARRPVGRHGLVHLRRRAGLAPFPPQRLLGLAGSCVRNEVAGRQPQLAEQVEDLLQLARLKVAEPELRGHQVPGGPLHHGPARVGDLGEPAPAVGRVRPADHHLLPFQAADDVGDAGRVHHQPLADHPERQRATAAEGEEHQRLVPREGQPVRPQQRVELAEQDLLSAHDRGDRGHRRRGTEPAGPDLRGPVDGIKRQFKGLTHGITVFSLRKQLVGGREGVQGAVGDLAGQLVEAARGQPATERGEGQRGEFLARPGLAPPLQLAGRVEPGPVLVQAAHQLLDPLPLDRHGADDGRLPVVLAVLGERDHVPQVPDHLLGVRLVRLVHHEQVGDLEDAGLGRLDRVAHPRREQHQHGVRQRR